MHDWSLMRALVRQVNAVAEEQHAQRVQRVVVRLGVLSHGDPEDLRLHFARAAQDTVAASAVLEIIPTNGLFELALDSLELEVAETYAEVRPESHA